MKTTFKMLFVLFYCPMITAGNGAETKALSTKVPVLFAHGFGGTKTRRLLYTRGYEKFLSLFYPEQSFAHTSTNYLFDRNLHHVTSFNFKDVQVDMGVYGSVPNPLSANLAQLDDIERLHASLERMPNDPIIGFGYSRGAATWITTLGSKIITKNIAGVILESPFSTVKNTYIHSLIGYFVDFLHTIIPSIDKRKTNDRVFESVFQRHSLSGPQPIDVVGMINKEIPMLIVHSIEDTIIPINQSRDLYIRLRQTGHEKVYFCEIEHGEHACLIWGPQGDLYRNVVHAFYKKHNLPSNPEFASKVTLENYQPSIAEVQSRIDKTNGITTEKHDSDNAGNAGQDFFSTCLNIFI